jgi:hypothetical protein
MLASIQPASVNQSKGDLGIPADSEKRGNALAANNILFLATFGGQKVK